MWTIANLLSRKKATILQGEALLRKKVAVLGDNKLAIVLIACHWFIMSHPPTFCVITSSL